MKTKTIIFKVFITFLYFTIVLQVKSQPSEFAPDGARWWYSYLGFQSMPPYSQILSPRIIKVAGDTTINNRHCKKVCIVNQHTGNCSQAVEFLFDSSGYVLWYMAEVDSFVTL